MAGALDRTIGYVRLDHLHVAAHQDGLPVDSTNALALFDVVDIAAGTLELLVAAGKRAFDFVVDGVALLYLSVSDDISTASGIVSNVRAKHAGPVQRLS